MLSSLWLWFDFFISHTPASGYWLGPCGLKCRHILTKTNWWKTRTHRMLNCPATNCFHLSSEMAIYFQKVLDKDSLYVFVFILIVKSIKFSPSAQIQCMCWYLFMYLMINNMQSMYGTFPTFTILFIHAVHKYDTNDSAC